MDYKLIQNYEECLIDSPFSPKERIFYVYLCQDLNLESASEFSYDFLLHMCMDLISYS